MTPDELREKVCGIFLATDTNSHIDSAVAADAAIRVVVEACAEICKERADEHGDAEEYAQDAGATGCAIALRALLPTANKEPTP